jgi:hypothetical protein
MTLEYMGPILLKKLNACLFIVAILTGAQGASAETSALDQALGNSDDSDLYFDEFVLASEKLIDRRTCTVADFREAGGWVKATGVNQSQPVYFTYCGGFTVQNRWYVNVQNGRIYQ